MNRTIKTLPETNGATLCLSFTGAITAEDFTALAYQPLHDILKVYDHYNLCIIYEEGFEGWSPEAADLSFRCISTISPKARRAAYVNAPDSRRLLMKMVQPLTPLEVRYFDTGEEKEALNWVQD